MQNKTHIGIDPGKSGAIVYLSPQGEVTFDLFPLAGDEYDIQEMSIIFARIRDKGPKNVHVIIEDIKALQKPFDRANWSLSGCKHILITLCTVHCIPFTLVAPKTWQKDMWVGIPEQRKPSKLDKNGKLRPGSIETKVMSLLAAKRLFPEVDLRKSSRAKIDHDGVVDALLMAEYSRRKFD